MADQTPRSKLRSAVSTARKTYTERLLIADSYDAWAPVLEEVGLLDAHKFSEADGAAEAAGKAKFKAAATADAARDRAEALLDKLSAAADKIGAQDIQALKADPAKMMREFRKVASILSGRETAMRSIADKILHEQDAAPVAGGGVGGGGGGGGDAPDILAAQLDAFKFQNNGEAMAAILVPPPHMVERIVADIQAGRQLASLSDLFDDFDDDLMRHALVARLERALQAALVATCNVIGTGHLKDMKVEAVLDKIGATINDAPAYAGGKQSAVNELTATVRTTVETDKETVSKDQTRRLVKNVWRKIGLVLRRQQSLNVACAEATVEATDLPPSAGPAKKASGAAGSSRSAISRRRTSPREHHGGRSRGGKARASPERSPTRSRSRDRRSRSRDRRSRVRSRSRSQDRDRRRGSHRSDDDDDDDDDDNDYRRSRRVKFDDKDKEKDRKAYREKYAWLRKSRDKWGGARDSTLGCDDEARKRGSCRDKGCPYSHDPDILRDHKPRSRKPSRK